MDFVPEDMDKYVEQARQVDRVLGAMHSDEVLEAGQELAEALDNMLVVFMKEGGLSPLEAVSSVSAIVGVQVAKWYAP